MTVEQPSMLSEYACDRCHDKGRIYEYWGKTAGKAYRCPEGCPQVPWSDVDTDRARVIHHKPVPPLGVAT